MDKIKLFEAFKGYGSQALALKYLGLDYETVGTSEIDTTAIKAYELLHGKVKEFGDISKITPKDLPDMDLFTYSFPCTDISNIGEQKGLSEGSGTRSSLLWECRKIIEEKRPKYLLLENVKALVGEEFIGDFNKWLNILHELGYTSYWKVVSGMEHNVPQKRERVFVVSILGNHKPFYFPKATKLTKSIKDILEKDYDKRCIVPKRILHHFVEKEGSFGEKFRLLKLSDSAFTLTTRGGYAAITNNYILNDFSEYKKVKNYSKKPCLNELWKKDITIRSLTPLECGRLMGVKDEDLDKLINEFSWYALYKLFGNSIVVDVLMAIFRQMFIGDLPKDYNTNKYKPKRKLI